MNSIIAKYLLYYPAQFLRGQKVWKYIPEVTPLQSISYKHVQQIRDERIRNLIQYSYKKIPYYRKLFDEMGISHKDIQGYNDLKLLPILKKKTILENKDSLINPHSRKRQYERKTGGSTGMVLHFMKEAEALAKNDAIMFRCYNWYDIDIGDKQVRFWGVPIDQGKRFREAFKDAWLNRIRISAFNITEETCINEYKRILKYKPAYFYGYTTAMYGFCHILKNLGFHFRDIELKAVICTAEKMYPHHRELLSEMFECPIVDEYGSSENGVIAFQCKQGSMHLMSDHLAIEFVDDNGERVAPGEPGRIIITDLSSFQMPQIRYDIGDIGSFSESTCSCGITLPIMNILEGRKEDFIRTKNGKMIHAAYLCYTLKEDSVAEFKMYQKSLDQFHVQIVKTPKFNNNSEKKLEKNLRSALGDQIHLTFEYIDNIPREKSGKLRYFVSEI